MKKKAHADAGAVTRKFIIATNSFPLEIASESLAHFSIYVIDHPWKLGQTSINRSLRRLIYVAA